MSQRRGNYSIAFISCFLLLPACVDKESKGEQTKPTLETTPANPSADAQIHITAAIHLEPSPSYGECGPNNYDKIRTNLVRFVSAVVDRGAALNIQSDNTFFEGIALCESNVDKSDTDGNDIGTWLGTLANVEVDAHKEGGNERNPEGNGPDDTLYADVHALAKGVVPTVSDVVGGFIWQSSEQVTQLRNASGLEGVLPNSPAWVPQILTLAVGEAHHQGNFSDDDFSSGLWRPAGAGEDFVEDAEDGPVYVGPGLQHSDWNDNCKYGFESAADYSSTLLSMMDAGDIPAGFYTATIAIPQSAVNASPSDAEGKYQKALDFIDAVNTLITEDSRVTWSTYTQVVDHWQSDTTSTAYRFDFTDIPRRLHSCTPN